MTVLLLCGLVESRHWQGLSSLSWASSLEIKSVLHLPGLTNLRATLEFKSVRHLDNEVDLPILSP